MANATARDEVVKKTVKTGDPTTELIERRVEVVTTETSGRPLFWTFLTVLLVLAIIAAAVLIRAAGDDGPAAVDEVPDGRLEGVIHWQAELAATAFPALIDRSRGIVLVGHDNRPDVGRPADLVALNLATGRELWRSTVPEPFVDAHGLTGEIAVATVAVEGDVEPVDAVGFDIRTGKEMWRQTLQPGAPDPVVLEDVVLVAGPDLVALDPPTGRQVWRADVDVATTPTVRDGVAYVAGPGELSAVEVDDGDIRWSRPSDNVAAFPSSPVLHDHLVIAANLLGEVIALERDSGELVYRVLTDGADDPGDPLDQVGRGAVGLFGPSGGRLFVGTQDSRMLALDADTGRVLWTVQTDLDFTEPVVSPRPETVVIGGDDETEVVAFDAADGTERWRFETGDTIPPIVRDGRVYLLDVRTVDDAHDLVALDLETGEKAWQVELEHPAFGAPVHTEGIVIIPTAERTAGTDTLYAIR